MTNAKAAATYHPGDRPTDLEPGSADWLRYITSSKVAVILGYSPYSSSTILWHQMTGSLPPEDQTEEMARGHYLEPAVLNWFFDRHPELERRETSTQYSDRLSWAAARPDAVAVPVDGGPVRPVEGKTENDTEKWGRPGTDEIPVDYIAQCLWTMHVMGAEEIYVPMLGPFLAFAEYRVQYNPLKAAQMERKCLAFLNSLSTSSPPPLSGHSREYEILRKLHPSIDLQASVELDQDLAVRFLKAKQAEKAASVEWDAARAAVNEVMGEAARAVVGDITVAVRQAKGQGVPYVAAPRKLPALEAIAS